MSLQYIKKEVRKGVHFQLADEHQSFLQVDFNTLGIKDAYKVILSLLLGMIKHSQSTQSNKFAISLQYLKKEVRKGVHFQLANEHQSFLQVDFNTLGIKDAYKVILSLLLGMIKHSQSTQNNKFAISLQYLKKKKLGREFIFCIQIFYGGPAMFVVTTFLAEPDQKFSARLSQYNN